MITNMTATQYSTWNELGRETRESINRSDLEEILASHPGNSKFKQALSQIANGRDLIHTLSCYIYFNSVFGSGVANLAGEIGSRQHLFRDPDEPVEIVADRSVEVAAPIFFAAIDEFGGSGMPSRSTHRTLAQATLKASASFLSDERADLNQIIEPNVHTLLAVDRVRDGYALNQAVDDEKIFRAIGFHISSEVLADEEFNILDHFLRAEYADLVEHLMKVKVTINNTEVAAYRWIQIHTTVEADHFNAALLGANLALRYYAGPESAARIKEWILCGFKEFAIIQAQFMEGLMGSYKSSQIQS